MGFGWFFKFGLAKAAQNIRFLSIFNGIDRVTGDTFTSSGQTTTDYLAVSTAVPSNSPAVTGSRIVRNLLAASAANLTTWTKSNGGTGIAPVVSLDAPSGMYRVQLNKGAGTGTGDYSIINIGTGGQPVPRNVLLSFDAKSYDGNTYIVTTYDGSSTGTHLTKCKIGPNLRRFYLNPRATASATVNFSILLRGSTTYDTGFDSVDILISNPQYVNVTDIPIKPGETVACATAASYDYTEDSVLKDIVCLGDSLTFQAVWPNQVENKIYYAAITNKGTGGNKLSDLWARWNADVLALSPESVAIQGGVNDVGTASSSPIPGMQTNMTNMVESALANNIVPFVFNLSPFGNNIAWTEQRQAWAEEWNAWLASYCTSVGVVMVDLYETLRTPGDVTMLAAYDSGDGLHPNLAGYIAMADAFCAAVPVAERVELYQANQIGTFLGTVKTYQDTDPTNFKRLLIASGVVYARPTSGVFQTNNHGVRIRLIPTANGQSGWAINTYTSAAAEYGITITATAVVLRKRNGSTDTDVTVNYTHTQNVPFEIDFYTDAGSGMGIRCREYTGGEWQAWTSWSEATTAAAKANATIAATYQIGSRNGANQFAGNYQYAAFVGGDNVKSKLENL